MDNYFKELAMAQIKLFIFAGHDTTSISAVYTYHLLAKYKDALARIRTEDDSVFGSDFSQAGSLLSSNPRLINQLPYTLACIKEAMRLYPPVAGLRQGQPNYFLIGADGSKFPTENCLVWGNHYGLHHNPHYWPRSEEFLPER